MNDQSEIAETLKTARTIAVVGLSNNPARPAYGVAAYLQRVGYTVIPVGPDPEVLGRQAYPDLPSVPVRIDLVDIFRRPEFVLPHVQEAIAVKARSVWLQMGIRAPEAERLAEDAGLVVVADRCTKIEHARLVATGQLPGRAPSV